MVDPTNPLTATLFLNQPKPPSATAETAGTLDEATLRQKASEIAKEFEALFLQEMLQPIFNQIDTNGPFGGGAAEAAFQPLLLQEYAQSISETGGIGVSDAIMNEILRMQGLEE